jgi:hypothetical protein
MNIVNTYHKQISQFKNKHVGETCYIFGSGPTVANFKEIEPGVYIGGNHIIKNSEIRDKLKYYFFGDGYKKYQNETSSKVYQNHYKEVNELPYDLQKFCMVSRDNILIRGLGYSQKDFVQLSKINAIPCDMTIQNINKDIDISPFYNHSIVYPQVQFALFAGFTKIYLVGCDCTTYSKSKQQISRQPYFFHGE